MSRTKMGKGVIRGKNVTFGKNVTVWNYVVIGDNTKIGDETCIGSFCDIGRDVIIGNNCMVQAQVTISNGCRIGNNVFIGPNTSIFNDKYPASKPLSPSIVQNNVIIGGCVAILPNVTIKENAVVAAGSTVTKNVSPGVVVKGIPAKPMMSREDFEKKRKAFMALSKK